MSENAKLNVISSILSFSGRWFTNSELADEAGITKQLANYHMRRFVDNGTIQHDAKRRCYKIIEVDNLVKELAGIRVTASSASLEDTPLIPFQNVEYLKGIIELAAIAEGLGIHDADRFRKRVAEEFDEASRAFKKMASKVRNTRLDDEDRAYKRIKNLQPLANVMASNNLDLWDDGGEILERQFQRFGIDRKPEAVIAEWRSRIDEIKNK